jgi:serpin B
VVEWWRRSNLTTFCYSEAGGILADVVMRRENLTGSYFSKGIIFDCWTRPYFTGRIISMDNKLTLYAIVIILLTVIVSLPVLSCVPVIPDEIALPGTPNELEVIIPDDIDSLFWSNYQSDLDEDALTLANGNNDFSCELYKEFIEEEDLAGKNIFYSSYSIYLALAMVYIGARGDTAEQISDTLHFNMPAEQVPPAFRILDQSIGQPGTREFPGVNPDGTSDYNTRVEKDNYQLDIANALWGQEGYPFLPQYIETVDNYYGGGLESLNFAEEPDPSRIIINDWVSEKTHDRINDLLPPGSISSATRLVITNAIYFFSFWRDEFNEKNTVDKPFYLLDGETLEVPTMEQTLKEYYTEGNGYKAVRLGYIGGDLDMVIILPDIDKFDEFEQQLDSRKLKAIVNSMESRVVDLSLPKFEYTSVYEKLGDYLSSMGIKDAFSPEADLSGITKEKDVFIGQAIHKAFILVNEEGTEAAAATAFFLTGAAPGPPPPPPATFFADHPFIYFIRHQKTGAILFMGRVLNPAE